MGIDGIGKRGTPPAAHEPHGGAIDKKHGVDAHFAAEAVQKTASPEATAMEAAHAASPLGRLRAGEIDVDRYVDLKVDEATHGLDGLSAAELDDIKKVLRDQLATDPGLSDLVHTAAGQLPKPPPDE
jgi:hypothetical protein